MSTDQALDYFIQWHFTDNCNLHCKHCYQSKRTSNTMSMTEIIDALNEIDDTFKTWKYSCNIDLNPGFNITGGEPLLREDIFEILSEIHVKGYEIYLLTNGTLIDKEKAARLFDLGIDGVQVSIEGPEKVHDSIRGDKSFSAAVKGVKELVDAGLTVTLNTTLSSLNAGFFEDTLTLASGLGVQKLGFSRLVPSGAGKSMLKDMLEAGEVRRLYDTIFSSDSKGMEIVTGDPVASQLQFNGNNIDSDIPLSGCSAGVSGLTILSDGTLVPCRRLPVPVGSIKKDSIREVWANSRVLNMLRNRREYSGKCGSCRKWANCRGCRGIAYAYSQANGGSDFLAADPQCFIIQ